MREEKKKVLIVEDQPINRQLLAKILSANYETIEAENGKEALELLEQYNDDISAVLLDLVMPIMDGYKFLEEIKKTDCINLPIIAITGERDLDVEERVLNTGAWDFVLKPYHPQVLLSRLRNAIARSRLYLLDQMQYRAEHDMLTQTYNRTKMYSESKKLLEKYPDDKFAFIRLDVDRFRMINSFWGESEGDNYLKYMGELLKMHFSGEKSVFGRMNADVFCICTEYEKDDIEYKLKAIKDSLQEYNRDYWTKPSFGIYVIDQKDLPIEKMYTRSHLAAERCKKIYTDYYFYFEEEMEKKMMEEQDIVNQMKQAIEREEFVVYLQPKMLIDGERISGAEALVRWINPQRGLISPGSFIPIFERNGFINKLDFYMWEKVCQLISKWDKEGIAKYPISVNISRMNMYNPNLVEVLEDLVKKYNISKKYFHLELTESALMDSPEMMKATIHKLKKAGFTILMDDFGSGYSSLNTLKDIDVDILKLDMVFLSGTENNDRDRIILKNIIIMAKQLNMPVIAEGVETKKQVEYLKEVGCEFIQGYYYAKPMPVGEYLEYVAKNEKGIAKIK